MFGVDAKDRNEPSLGPAGPARARLKLSLNSAADVYQLFRPAGLGDDVGPM